MITSGEKRRGAGDDVSELPIEFGELTGLFELGQFLVEVLQCGLENFPVTGVSSIFQIV